MMKTRENTNGYIAKKATMLTLLLFCLLLCAGSFCLTANAASSPRLNKKQISLAVGQTTTLKIKGKKGKVKWSSSNKKVASVGSKGNVRAKKAGKTTITAKVGKRKLSCKVTVKKNEWIGFTKSQLHLTALWKAVKRKEKSESSLLFLPYKLSYNARGILTAHIAAYNSSSKSYETLKAAAVKIGDKKGKAIAQGIFGDEEDRIPPKTLVYLTMKFSNGTERVVNLNKTKLSYAILTI